VERSEWLARLPRNLYTAAQVRALDRQAIEEYGIPGFDLMMRAAASVLAHVLQRWPQARRLLVFTGSGNNAGDGYLLATLAHERGVRAVVLEAGDPARLGPDAARARTRALEAQVPALPLDSPQGRQACEPGAETVVIDALLGIGLSGPVRPALQQAIAFLNALQAPVVAIDIPSGLCPDTGVVQGVAVHAALTVCCIALKQGLLTAQGPDHTGELVVDDLGLPPALWRGAIGAAPAVSRVDIHSESGLLQARALGAHKGDAGQVLVIGGDTGMGGAALLAAEAAGRSGAGIVRLLTRQQHVPAVLARRPEIMVQAMESLEADAAHALGALLRDATAIVIGPGLGRSPFSRQLLREVLAMVRPEQALVLDADALNLLAQAQQERTDTAPSGVAAHGLHRREWVLTPHPGEAARLLGCTTAEIQADRFAAVRALQSRWGGVVLLKGLGSLICHASEGTQQLCLCSEGNPGMASGGMGDVLAGLTGALLAQGLPAPQALTLAVCVHGEAADLAARADGERGLLASDLLPHIRRLLNRR
jgi:hydroxyethylthiazole kinase-like uncharacterized protein yjeF